MDIKAELEGLRGREYYDRWADIWAENLQHVKQQVIDQRATGEFRVAHAVVICDAHGLPWKPFVLQLEKEGLCPHGTYDKCPPIGKLRKAPKVLELLAARASTA